MAKSSVFFKAKIEKELRKRKALREQTKRPFGLLELILNTYPKYMAGWFHQLLCDKLEQFVKDVEDKKNPRLLITVPPRHGKSQIVSIHFPVYALLKHSDWNVIAASYSADLAEKASRQARDILQSPFVKNNCPDFSLSSDRKAVSEWETNQRGGYKAAGIQGSITGFGANVFIIDDPVKGRDEAFSKIIRDKIYDNYRSVIETRLAPQSGIILCQTRWHEDDLSGRLLTEEAHDWEHLNFPAIAERDEEFRKLGEALHPERYSLEFLEKIKKKAGWVWEALYQQRPVAAEGDLIKRGWWKLYQEPPKKYERILTSWDMAFKGKSDSKSGEPDYVVGQVWGKIGANAFLIDLVRGQWDFPETLEAVKALHRKYPECKEILVEDKANGAAVMASLKNQIPGIIAVEPEGGKESRAAAVSPIIEAGNAILPKFAGFTESFIDECAAFPKGKHDDQVDCMSQAFSRLFVTQSFFGVID